MEHALQGPALVDAVAARAGLTARRRPTSAALRTPSLDRWRAYSSEWAPERAMPWPRLLARLAPGLRGLDAGLDGACYPLVFGDEQASFLYEGARDALGELPVLTVDARDQIVVLAAPGLDVWLALLHDHFGEHALGEVPAAYRARMAWHARHSLGGPALLRLREATSTKPPAKPPKPAAQKKRAGLSDETRAAIAALAKRRKGDVLLAALELAKKLEGKLDDPTAKAVAKELGRFPDEGVTLAFLLRTAPGSVRKDRRLKR